MTQIRDLPGRLTPDTSSPAPTDASSRTTETRANQGARDSVERQAAPDSHTLTPGVSLPPPTPPAAVLPTAVERGARSFAEQLLSLDPGMSDSADNLVASFMKLQSLDASTGQQIEGELQQARHLLREAALILERRLASRLNDIPGMREQASQLEDEAESEYETSLMKLGPEAATALRTNLWQTALDGISAKALAAADLRAKAKSLAAEGKTTEAAALQDQAMEIEAGLRGVFESFGLPGTEDRVLALEVAATAARTAHEGSPQALARYFANAPEDLQKVLPNTTAAELLQSGFGAPELQAAMKNGQGTTSASSGQASGEFWGFFGALMEDHSADDQLLMTALAFCDESAIEKAVYDTQTQLQATSANHAAAQQLTGLDGTMVEQEASFEEGVTGLASAAGKMEDSMELWTRAALIYSAYNDAKLAARECRYWDATHGVGDRNAARQKELMTPLLLAMSGTRADQELAHDAQAMVDQARNEVARLVRDLVDRHTVTQAGLRRT